MFKGFPSGNLASEPKQRTWKNKNGGESKITEFTIATKDDKRDEPTWLKCICWDQKLAENIIMPYAKKGTFAMVTGGMRMYSFEGREGPVPVIEMKLDGFQLGPKTSSTSYDEPEMAPDPEVDEYEEVDDTEEPF